MAKVRIGILGSTKGTDMQGIIDAIRVKELDAEIVLVASDREDAPILERAANNGIRTAFVEYKSFQDRSDADAALAERLKEQNVQLILLIGFMKILGKRFVEEFHGRIWNVHPSLLPKYAGGMNLDVHKLVISNHDAESGCTLHEVAEEVDKGRIIMQKRCKVLPGETPESLKEKVQKLEQECLVEAIGMVSEGRLKIGTGR